MRVPFDELLTTLHKIFLKLDLEDHRARLCAQLFAEATRDGVYSHGLNRFPLFVSMIKSGVVQLCFVSKTEDSPPQI